MHLSIYYLPVNATALACPTLFLRLTLYGMVADNEIFDIRFQFHYDRSRFPNGSRSRKQRRVALVAQSIVTAKPHASCIEVASWATGVKNNKKS